MSERVFKFSVLGLLLVAFFAVFVLTAPATARPAQGVTNFDSIWLRDTGGTAQPVLRADQRGTGKVAEFMDSGTPVLSLLDGGAVRGKVLAFPTPNLQANCKTNTITDTASYTATVTAIGTPVYTWCSMNAITGDAAGCAATFGQTANITITVRDSAATPAANAAGAAVTWCVVGSP